MRTTPLQAELFHMDLRGKPLAYTPFCDSNKAMDGYRFWQQGFWRSHLDGKPYHISALYVVDLELFRQVRRHSLWQTSGRRSASGWFNRACGT